MVPHLVLCVLGSSFFYLRLSMLNINDMRATTLRNHGFDQYTVLLTWVAVEWGPRLLLGSLLGTKIFRKGAFQNENVKALIDVVNFSLLICFVFGKLATSQV